METQEFNNNTPSRVLLILVKGSRESLISRTTFVLLSKAGSILVNFIMCPGNHDGGLGRAGRWVKAIFRTRGMAESEFRNECNDVGWREPSSKEYHAMFWPVSS